VDDDDDGHAPLPFLLTKGRKSMDKKQPERIQSKNDFAARMCTSLGSTVKATHYPG
jgi:hypothetical protein